ncbi:MAG: AI-2E family transporter [Planctomycetaceae bacterium]
MVRLSQMPRLVSLLILTALLVGLGLTFYQVVAPFLLPLFLAAVLALVCQPMYRRMLSWMPARPRLAAGLTTAVLLVMIFVPLFAGTISAANQLNQTDWGNLATRLRQSKSSQWLADKYFEWTGTKVDVDEVVRELVARVREESSSLANKTLGSAGTTLHLLGGAVSLLVGALTFVMALYYFLADGPRLIDSTEQLIPVHRDYQRQLLVQFDQAVRAVVSATFAAALAQGLATAIGMRVAGYPHFFLVLMLATLTALVPLLGTWLIWAPYALSLAILDDKWLAATLLTLYGVVFIGILDNLVRTWVLHSNVKLHPLLAFVSVLGGIETMGLWGVFIGPIVASCLYALVRIFNTELVAFSQERQAGRLNTNSTDPATAPLPGDSRPAADASKPAAGAPDGLEKPRAAAPQAESAAAKPSVAVGSPGPLAYPAGPPVRRT